MVLNGLLCAKITHSLTHSHTHISSNCSPLPLQNLISEITQTTCRVGRKNYSTQPTLII